MRTIKGKQALGFLMVVTDLKNKHNKENKEVIKAVHKSSLFPLCCPMRPQSCCKEDQRLRDNTVISKEG